MKEELRYLERLAELYPTIGKASTEIINLQSILNLPKGTEHFMSDLHGEYEAFSHVLRNGSGAVRKKINDVFGHTLSNSDKRALATLIYYPREKIQLVKKTEEDMENWYKITLYRLIEVCKTTASKYTRSKVRKALPPDYAYVIEELITEYEVDRIVLGYPKNMNNTEGERCEKTQEFRQMLERRTGLPVILWDERLTTVLADQAMMEGGIRRENRKEYVDKLAAVFILQNYLDASRQS